MQIRWLDRLLGCKQVDPQQTRYDETLLAYLKLWGAGDPDHERVAQERFGFSEEDIEWVNQVLVSAAVGTLRNYTNRRDDPWFQAAWRLAHSRRRRLLHPLQKTFKERVK